jgi:hypothetical protein
MGRRYPEGSRVLVTPLTRTPRVGEVWVFCTDGGRMVAHRFLRRRAGMLVFRGDAEPVSDPPVHPEWLVGIVALVDCGGRCWRPRTWQALGPLARVGRDRLLRRSQAPPT